MKSKFNFSCDCFCVHFCDMTILYSFCVHFCDMTILYSVIQTDGSFEIYQENPIHNPIHGGQRVQSQGRSGHTPQRIDRTGTVNTGRTYSTNSRQHSTNSGTRFRNMDSTGRQRPRIEGCCAGYQSNIVCSVVFTLVLAVAGGAYYAVTNGLFGLEAPTPEPTPPPTIMPTSYFESVPPREWCSSGLPEFQELCDFRTRFGGKIHLQNYIQTIFIKTKVLISNF